MPAKGKKRVKASQGLCKHSPKTSNCHGLVIGVDQALETTGVAICFLNIFHIYTFVFKTERKYSIEQRLHQIDFFFTGLFNKLNPACVALEEVYQGQFRTSALRLAQVYSTLTNACLRANLDYTTFASAKTKRNNSWTYSLGLNGTKEYCREWLLKTNESQSEILKLTDHECDAIGIAWAKIVKDEVYLPSDILKFTIEHLAIDGINKLIQS